LASSSAALGEDGALKESIVDPDVVPCGVCWTLMVACKTQAKKDFDNAVEVAKVIRDADLAIAKAEKDKCLLKAKRIEDKEDRKEAIEICEENYADKVIEIQKTYGEAVKNAFQAWIDAVETCEQEYRDCLHTCGDPPHIDPDAEVAHVLAPDMQGLKRAHPDAHRTIADGTYDTYTLDEQWDFVSSGIFGVSPDSMPEDMDKRKLLRMLRIYNMHLEAGMQKMGRK